MKKYKIPRNVKVGQLFLNLDLKGWIIFIPLSAIIGYILFSIPRVEIRVTSLIIFIPLLYFSLQLDEKTGVRNILLTTSRLRWFFDNEKVIRPVWGEKGERFKTLQITVNIKQKQRKRDS